MKMEINKIIALTFVVLILISGFTILNVNATSKRSNSLKSNGFTERFSLNYTPENPSPDQDVQITIDSNDNKNVARSLIYFQYKTPSMNDYSSVGNIEMQSTEEQYQMEGVIDGNEYHGQPGIKVKFWINATLDSIDWFKSDEYIYTVKKEGGWINDDFSDNLRYSYEPIDPKSKESVDVTLEKKVDVEINSALIMAEIDQPGTSPQEGSIEFEKKNQIWKATIPAYPRNTSVDFHIYAYDKYNQEIVSANNEYTVKSNITIKPLIVVKDKFENDKVDGAEVIVKNESETVVYEGKVKNGKLNIEESLKPGSYDLKVNYKGESKSKSIELTGKESEEQATYTFKFETKSSMKHGMISFPQEYILLSLLGSILIPLFLLGFVYKKKEEKQIELVEGNQGETTSTHPIIDDFWERIVRETGEPQHLIPVGFFFLSLFGLSFIPFYPWWMIGIVSIVIGAVSYKYPYNSLLILALFVTGSAAYQSPEFGLVMLVFSLLILLVSFFDWKFGFLVFLIIFLARIGAIYFVPVMSVVLFSIYLSVISTAVAGIFLVLLSSSSNFELLGFVTTSPHKTAFMRFDKPVVSNFKPSSLGESLAGIGNANADIIGEILANNFGASILPFFQVLLWCIALYLIYMIVETREPKLNKLIQWVKYPLKKDWKKTASASILLGISPIFGLLYFDYFAGMKTLDIIWIGLLLAGGVVLSFVSIGLGFMTKSLFREYYRSKLGISDVGTRIAEMADLGETPFKNVGGLTDVKNEVKESILMPLLRPDISEKFGVETSKGMMLYGPPGCGKTLLAKAIANESESNFISIKGPEIFSKWVGESEKAVREIFRKARQAAPSIIYFDEIDAITSGRGQSESTHTFASIVNQVLVEMDGIENRKGIVTIASTNRPDIVDPAFLRPGRFDRLIYVKAPDEESRLKILEVHSQNMPLTEDISLRKIAQQTDGFSGADLENLCREAGMEAIREKMTALEKIELKHFERAMSKIKSTLPQSIIDRYEEMARQITESRNIKEPTADLYK